MKYSPESGYFCASGWASPSELVVDIEIDKIMGENLCVPSEVPNGIVENTMDQRLDVYIWDMDETLILLKSMLNGMYAEAFNGSKDAQIGAEIGTMWEKHILDLCDNYFFYEQVC